MINLSDDLIKVVKYRRRDNKLNYIYIGRKFGDLEGSILKNKFKIGRDGNREEVIVKYKRWLWMEMKKGIKGEKNEVWEYLKYLSKLVKEGKEIELACWCKPRACHGDVVKLALKWMIGEGY